MSIEALKEQARRHEQKEQWQKALDLYVQAMSRLDGADQIDISLFNRAGDLCTRLKKHDNAVEYYEKSVNAYVEAELPNNAIAICKKVLRNLPDRHEIFLRMGQIRAAQGFIPDARECFLEYAGRMEAMGEINEALRALIEFAALVPADFEIRLSVGQQLQRNERGDEAIEQFVMAHQELTRRGMTTEAGEVAAKIFELDPDAVIPGPNVVVEETPAEETSEEVELEVDGALMGIESTTILGEDEDGADSEGLLELDESDADELPLAGTASLDDLVGDLEELASADESESDELASTDEVEESPDAAEEVDADADAKIDEEADVLPTFGFAEEAEEAEDAAELPTFGYDPEEAGEDVATEDVATEDAATEDAATEDAATEGADGEEADFDIDVDLEVDLEEVGATSEDDSSGMAREQGHGGLAAVGDIGGAIDALEKLIDTSPADVALRETMVQYAFKLFDPIHLSTAYLGLARALERDGKLDRARDVYEQSALANPDNREAADAVVRMAELPSGDEESEPSESFVDLGAMVLGEPEEKTTRFVVAYEEPSGDEEADFAKMLAQFKDKVAENLDADDVAAHHDLGTAYLEMGLVDEAVAEFQQALRASPNHLPTFEMLGRAFLEKGEPEATVRSLTRALDTDYQVEDELIGIYYYLGLAHQELAEASKALDFFDRVFALDINFGDVTERLRTLRD